MNYTYVDREKKNVSLSKTHWLTFNCSIMLPITQFITSMNIYHFLFTIACIKEEEKKHEANIWNKYFAGDATTLI